MATLARSRPRHRLFVGSVAAVLVGAILALLAWSILTRRAAPPSFPPPLIELQARRFVSLALTLGAIAPAEVDSYFGPDDIKPVAGKRSLPELRADLGDLAAALREGPGPVTPRRAKLAERTDRLLALVNTMGPVPKLSFDDEASSLYGLGPTTLDAAGFARDRAALDRLLPGPGSLVRRVEAFRRRFLIPEARRVAVFDRALAECRRRTLLHWRLPRSERLDVQWTDLVDEPWHRYRGHYRSTLQINPKAVAFLGSAVQVACHEAYPGHHAQFTLGDVAAGAGGLPVEERVVLVRTPAAILREGAAEFGASLAFPPADRLAFDRDVLMPLAGLPQAEAASFEEVRALLDRLALAAYPILRAYRDGRLDEAAAAAALERDALIASPRSLLEYTDAMGAYLAGYTAVRAEVQRRVTAPGSGDPWERLRCLLSAADEAPLARPVLRIPRCTATTNGARS